MTRGTRVHSTSQLGTVLAWCSVNQNRSEQEMERMEHQKRNLINFFFFFYIKYKTLEMCSIDNKIKKST